MATIAPAPRELRRAAPLRLTRRGRLLVTAATAIALAALPLLLGFVRADSAVAGDGAATTAMVVVGSGETLWAIADRVDSARDPRTVIAEIVELNSLSGHVVLPGQSLLVPVAASR